ncbi:MAG TPA: hypothetical protein DEP37_09515 [Algoriphagus sp.]|nr:hypothetical protein [Algoriphagus sp.]|tara:strand:- start:423 stop:1076 length:654 start_codon:yes stop_codon:yes gene_type:complete
MKPKPKKKKKSKGKISPPSVPSDPIPPEWLDLVPDHSNTSLSDVFNTAEDTMALQVGNKPSMEELIRKAKKGNKKSFLDLIKIKTSAHPFDDKEDSTLIIPYIKADRDFYEQEWVQKILVKKMEDEKFRKDFWKAVFSRQNDTLFKATASELKRYISIRKSEWARLGMTVADIKKELQSKKLLSRELRAKGTLEKFLERCGVKRPKARGRPKKKNTT